MIVVPDFLQKFLYSYSYESTVISYGVGTGTTTLVLDNSYHCRNKLVVFINGIDYEIVNFNSLNNSIMIGVELEEQPRNGNNT
jgi:hypothetical protein